MRSFKCCYCYKIKQDICFYRDKSRPSGYKPRCKECEKLYKNYKLRRKYEKQYRENNPEKRRVIMRNWNQKNKVDYCKTLSDYRKTKQFRINHRKHAATRRARMNNVFIESVDFFEIYKIADRECEYCGKSLSFDEAEFDHYIPISRGGLHEKSNIRCSCMVCNRSKGATMPERNGDSHQMV